jgi:DNA-binding response OmpR family regulator
MTLALNKAPHLALVDDDVHSARLLARTLAAQGAPHVEWLGDAEEARRRLVERLAGSASQRPGLLIVDLKTNSTATRDFIAATAELTAKAGLPVVAIVPDTGAADRQPLLAAGAAAIFRREAEREAYRREASNIVGFWARNQRLDAVGM